MELRIALRQAPFSWRFGCCLLLLPNQMKAALEGRGSPADPTKPSGLRSGSREGCWTGYSGKRLGFQCFTGFSALFLGSEAAPAQPEVRKCAHQRHLPV